MLEENLFLGSWLTLVGTGVIALLIGLIKLARRPKQSQASSGIVARMAHPLLMALPATALVWGYALRFCLRSVVASSPNVLRFGLPAAYWWIFAVAILIGLMTILLIGTAILAWKRHYWSLIGRFAISLTTLAAIIFGGMLAHWGLLTALLLRIK